MGAVVLKRVPCGFLGQGNRVTTLVVVKTPSSKRIIVERVPIAIVSRYVVPDVIMESLSLSVGH